MSNVLRESFDTTPSSPDPVSPRLTGQIRTIALMVSILLAGCAAGERSPDTQPLPHRSSAPAAPLSQRDPVPLSQDQWLDRCVNPEQPQTREQQEAGVVFLQQRGQYQQRRMNGLPLEIHLLEDELSLVENRLSRCRDPEQRPFLEDRIDSLKLRIAGFQCELHLLRVEAGEEDPGF